MPNISNVVKFRFQKEINNSNNLAVNLNDVFIVGVEPFRLKSLLYFVTDGGDLLSCRVEGSLAFTSVKLRLRHSGSVSRVLRGLRHGLAVRHELRLREGGGLAVPATMARG